MEYLWPGLGLIVAFVAIVLSSKFFSGPQPKGVCEKPAKPPQAQPSPPKTPPKKEQKPEASPQKRSDSQEKPTDEQREAANAAWKKKAAERLREAEKDLSGTGGSGTRNLEECDGDAVNEGRPRSWSHLLDDDDGETDEIYDLGDDAHSSDAQGPEPRSDQLERLEKLVAWPLDYEGWERDYRKVQGWLIR